MARVLPVDDAQTHVLAVRALLRGDAIAIPTETVYGLAADATNPDAIAAIFEAKGRPRFNPLICHVSDLDMARTHVEIPAIAEKLAAAFWPGPLTMVLPLKPESAIHPLATAGLSTAGIRMPEGFARQLIAAVGRPLAAPSANRSGRISPTSAAHVADDLGERIGLIVDGGACSVGLESTIVAVDDSRLVLLRPGGISADAIETAAGVKLVRPDARKDGLVLAPGMLASHYAPETPIRLNAVSVRPGEAVIRFGGRELKHEDNAVFIRDLSAAGDLREAAANLFALLKRADAAGASGIAVAPVPGHGLGEAINDRLSRAAAPKA